jgi:hypothetical protein
VNTRSPPLVETTSASTSPARIDRNVSSDSASRARSASTDSPAAALLSASGCLAGGLI